MEKNSFKSFLIFLIMFFLLWILRATLFYSIDVAIESESSRNIYSNLVKIILWIIPALIYILYVNKAKPLEYLKLITLANKKSLLIAAFCIAFYFVVIFAVDYYTTGRNLSLLVNSSLLQILKMLGNVSVSATVEEVLFRGFILRGFSERLSFWQANILTSVLFVLVHYPNWLWVNGFKPWILFNSVSILILSLFMGWLVKLTNSLYPGIVTHILNNFYVAFLRT